MTQVSSVPKIAFLSKHTLAREEVDEEEEYDMASHSVEDPVRSGPPFALMLNKYTTAY